MGNLSIGLGGYKPTKQLALIPTGSRAPAPGPLRLVQQFVNTADIYSEQEDLPDPAALKTWLADHRLLSADAKVTNAEHRRAIAVREALRRLLAGNHGDDVPAEARDTLNSAAERAAVSVHFDDTGKAALAPRTPGVDAALGQILAAVHAGMIDGTWDRLKVCQDDRCAWAFYDLSKNLSSRWCSMAVCGNRAKARKYRQRAKV